jgi:hypothetical protein
MKWKRKRKEKKREEKKRKERKRKEKKEKKKGRKRQFLEGGGSIRLLGPCYVYLYKCGMQECTILVIIKNEVKEKRRKEKERKEKEKKKKEKGRKRQFSREKYIVGSLLRIPLRMRRAGVRHISSNQREKKEMKTEMEKKRKRNGCQKLKTKQNKND